MWICVCMLAVWHVSVCIKSISWSICLYLKLFVVSSQMFINSRKEMQLGVSWSTFFGACATARPGAAGVCQPAVQHQHVGYYMARAKCQWISCCGLARLKQYLLCFVLNLNNFCIHPSYPRLFIRCSREFQVDTSRYMHIHAVEACTDKVKHNFSHTYDTAWDTNKIQTYTYRYV